ncbi:MAG: glycosyltransferase family protein [Caulobacteraceae bacterium]
MILAVLQARTASTRMPGKVMAPICGEPMIWRQLERIRTARSISKVVVATTVEPSDDGLAAFLLGRGVSVHRGEFKNVLGRFLACAEAWDASHVVRLSGDCPLTDPQMIDAAVGLALETGCDYVGNLEQRTYPQGLEVEVIETIALAAADREAWEARDRTDPTLFVRERPDRFTHACLTQARDLSGLHWSVERPEDFAFVRAAFEALRPTDPGFGLNEVLELLQRRPDLAPHVRAA